MIYDERIALIFARKMQFIRQACREIIKALCAVKRGLQVLAQYFACCLARPRS